MQAARISSSELPARIPGRLCRRAGRIGLRLYEHVSGLLASRTTTVMLLHGLMDRGATDRGAGVDSFITKDAPRDASGDVEAVDVEGRD